MDLTTHLDSADSLGALEKSLQGCSAPPHPLLNPGKARAALVAAGRLAAAKQRGEPAPVYSQPTRLITSIPTSHPAMAAPRLAGPVSPEGLRCQAPLWPSSHPDSHGGAKFDELFISMSSRDALPCHVGAAARGEDSWQSLIRQQDINHCCLSWCLHCGTYHSWQDAELVGTFAGWAPAPPTPRFCTCWPPGPPL